MQGLCNLFEANYVERNEFFTPNKAWSSVHEVIDKERGIWRKGDTVFRLEFVDEVNFHVVILNTKTFEEEDRSINTYRFGNS